MRKKLFGTKVFDFDPLSRITWSIMIIFNETFWDQDQFPVRTKKPQERKMCLPSAKMRRMTMTEWKWIPRHLLGSFYKIKDGSGIPNLWTLGWNCLKQCIRLFACFLFMCWRATCGNCLSSQLARVPTATSPKHHVCNMVLKWAFRIIFHHETRWVLNDSLVMI